MNTRSGKMSNPSGNAQTTAINPGTVGKKRKKSTAGISKERETSTVDQPDVHMDDDGVDTEETVAPTAFLHFKKKELKQREAKKKKQHTVTKKISDLTKERDSLCQQVGQNNSGTTDSSSSANTSPGASSFSSSFSSSSSSSFSSSSSSSTSFSSSSSSTSSTAFSDQKLKKKRKNKKMHRHRSQKKKGQKKEKEDKKGTQQAKSTSSSRGHQEIQESLKGLQEREKAEFGISEGRC
ncbi:zinc finger CCHC domain-containing protein 10-like isoform X1 [Oryzias latipes]|uniref:zinc finger CCHC domain-containing protein 10-like isoform X1 n=1 Tax=Oryzias latipes TaxID=8090 RepID=UPI000CE20125|nr:zinc finger CCHC domain-containing protein 10-like isoform X1 [Oryzias latipes]